MTPRLRTQEVGVMMASSVFIISVFGFQKSLGNLHFGFDLLATVRFEFQKSETELTFGLPHIPSYFTDDEKMYKIIINMTVMGGYAI